MGGIFCKSRVITLRFISTCCQHQLPSFAAVVDHNRLKASHDALVFFFQLFCQRWITVYSYLSRWLFALLCRTSNYSSIDEYTVHACTRTYVCMNIMYYMQDDWWYRAPTHVWLTNFPRPGQPPTIASCKVIRRVRCMTWYKMRFKNLMLIQHWHPKGVTSNGCFLKWWYPQKHPKMIIFSRKKPWVCWGNPLF